MLKGINPILGPEILHILASMGHGDEIILTDNNFPAAALAQRLTRLDGVTTTTALQAILTLFPLDQYVKSPVAVMSTVDENDATPETYADFQNILEKEHSAPVQMEWVERFAFYERARAAFAIVVTSDARLYANILLKKGVIEAPSKPFGKERI